MQNDAKLGLIVGVGVVLAVAVVFFRRDGDKTPPLAEGTAAAAVGAAKAVPSSSPSGASRSVKEKLTSQIESVPEPAQPTSRRHVVSEAETLPGMQPSVTEEEERP
jgi:hypothetical protein